MSVPTPAGNPDGQRPTPDVERPIDITDVPEPTNPQPVPGPGGLPSEDDGPATDRAQPL